MISTYWVYLLGPLIGALAAVGRRIVGFSVPFRGRRRGSSC